MGRKVEVAAAIWCLGTALVGTAALRLQGTECPRDTSAVARSVVGAVLWPLTVPLSLLALAMHPDSASPPCEHRTGQQ